MTSPDKYFPDTGVNSAPGFAAYAGTTQEDYEEMWNDQYVGLAGPLSGVCELLGMLPCLDGLLQMGGPDVNGQTGGLMQGTQNFADGLCSIHNDLTGAPSGTQATPAAVTAGVQDAASAAMGTPFTAGVVEMGQTNGTSGNLAVDANQGAQELANQLYGTIESCGCGPDYHPTSGVTPVTVINTAQQTSQSVQDSPFAMGIIARGQEPAPSGNVGSDAIAGAQGFADDMFNIFNCGCADENSPQQASPQVILNNTQQVADAYQASPMATGLVALGQEPQPSGNPAVDAINGGQYTANSLFNIFQLCGCGNDANPAQATPQDIIGTAQDTAAAAQATPITASILAMGQTDGSSGNVATDSMNGLQAFVNSICGSTGTSPAALFGAFGAGGDTSATDIALGAANLSAAVQATPFTAGLMEMSTDDTNGHAGNLLSGLQNFLDNMCGMSTAAPAGARRADPVYGSATPQAILDRVGALNDSVQSNPFYAQAMDYVPEPTGQTEADLHRGATAWLSEYQALQAVENPAYHAVDPSLSAVFNITGLTADAPTQISVTAAGGSAIGFIYMTVDATKSSIAWIGYGKTNITAIYARIYRVNAAVAQLEQAWESPNIVSSVPDALDWIYVPLDTTLELKATDWVGLEVEVVGTGTHTLVGMPDHWLSSNSRSFPEQLAATRASSVNPDNPFTPVYSANVPWLALSSLLAVQVLTVTSGGAIASGEAFGTPTMAQISGAAGFPYTFPWNLPDGYAASGEPPTDWAAGRVESFAWHNLTANKINALGAGTIIVPKRIQTSAAGTLSLTTAYNVWEFTGSTATWTMPAVSGNTHAQLILVNKGTGGVTINRAGSDQLYSRGTKTSVTLAAGRTLTMLNDGTYWLVMS